MHTHTYVSLLIVSHFIVLIIVNVLEKLGLNCQVCEAKEEVDREKCIVLVKVETLEEPSLYTLSLLPFFLSQVSFQSLALINYRPYNLWNLK